MHLLLFISMWSYSKKKKKEDVIETPKETQPKKPISFPHRQCTLLLTILHSDDVNLYFNSQLIITLPLCCLYTGVCNKFRAEIICFSVIERFINMENTQQSIINAGKQQHKYYIFFLFFLKCALPCNNSINLLCWCMNFCHRVCRLQLWSRLAMFNNYLLVCDQSLTSGALFHKKTNKQKKNCMNSHH